MSTKEEIKITRTEEVTLSRESKIVSQSDYLSILSSIDSIVVEVEENSSPLSFSILYFLHKHKASYSYEIARVITGGKTQKVRTHVTNCISELIELGLVRALPKSRMESDEIQDILRSISEERPTTPLERTLFVELTDSFASETERELFFSMVKRRAQGARAIDAYTRNSICQTLVNQKPSHTPKQTIFSLLDEIKELETFPIEGMERIRGTSASRNWLTAIKNQLPDEVELTWEDVLEWKRGRVIVE